MVSTPRKVAAFIITLLALFALALIAVNTGSLQVTPDQLFRGLFVAFDEDVSVVYDLRFPRIIVAMVGGAAMAVSGVLLQAAIRNPLADPGIIGINAGASLVAVVVTAFFPALLFFTPALAFAGGMLAFLIVYSLSWRGGLSPLRVILVGVAVGTMFSGLIAAFSSTGGAISSTVASLVDANITMKTWADVQTISLYTAVGLILALLAARRCDMLALEDKTARSLGVEVNASRMGVSAVAVLLASISTAIIGPISFLGLIVPHIARILVGTSHRTLIAYSIVLGALFLLAADTIGRTVAAPYEISAAVIMSIVGGPVFILLLRKARATYGE
ncbi:iron ABC transporter permease [Adlercreutzia sp. R25]|uniref:Probable heme-iron transport system permease protein IsdF n=1 Tax=Adlercreutzia shanghongiae TaxID=3111773 RepID=A0ABU6J0N3_9ACTN|nr:MULTISPECIES: iron ABC transporter permease [unclassified Adlercreutzia]MEC4273268.1 iron ABC transporter permease [Adlercreutzia sp. R25]MEC4295501.1 iron ABC transporter permease [Adlercreutzia sp. R22]